MAQALDLAAEPFRFIRAPTDSPNLGWLLPRIYNWLPALSLLYASVLFPILSLASPSETLDARVEHRIFWPAVAAISLFISTLILRERSLPRLSPTVLFLMAYLALACLSIGWSPTPDVTAKRVLQELFVVLATMVPVLMASDKRPIFDNILYCLVIGIAMNLVFLAVRPPTELGHAGVFSQKNVLGQFAAIAFLFSINYWAPKRPQQFLCGLFIAAGALVLLVMSQSKTSLALAVMMPMIAGFALLMSRSLRISPMITIILLLALASLAGFLAADALNISFEDLSLALFNDVTFTGRTFIWAFAGEMAERRPLLGWGYQSFWLVSRDAPSVVEAPGFIAIMPTAHNGYLDVRLETGWIGLAVVCLMVLSGLNGAGAARGRYSRQDWATLSLMLFLIIYNMMESSWTRGFDQAWLIFLIIAGATNAAECLAAPVHTARSASRLKNTGEPA